MIYSVTLWTLMSLILIILIHYLFNFFKETLTIPKVKDLVQQPTASYKNIEDIISQETTKSSSPKEKDINTNEMKDELKSFFKQLNQNKLNNEIVSANNFMSNSGTQNLYSQL